MEFELLKDLIVIFLLAIIVNLGFAKFKLPPILGFLITGIVAGPHGLSLVTNVHDIEILAEIGVILLLFTIGIEFSLKTFVQIRYLILVGGGLQVLFTSACTFAIVHFLNFEPGRALFLGFLVSLSSTAIVIKIIQEKAEMNTSHGRFLLGALIFQDLIIVPMIIFTPLLGGQSQAILPEIGWMIVKILLIGVFMIVLARYVIPWLLHAIAKTQKSELFLLTILTVGFAVAFLTSALGLSLALGAFLAGLIISESEYSHHAFGNVIPFRDIFTSIFFVSIGMLLNLDFLLQNPLLIVVISIGVIVIKTIFAGFSAFIIGFPFRSTVIAGLAISQMGEFSFVLAKIGMDYNLLDPFIYELFIAVSIITMALTPFIINISPKLASLLLKLPLPERVVKGLRPVEDQTYEDLSSHMVIVGYGVTGKNVARAARFAGINYCIIETDADLVREKRQEGEFAVYGDAAQEAVLKSANIHQAEVIVVAIADAPATFRITEATRKLNPGAHIIVKTRFLQDLEDLHLAGANEVIPDEFETSVEIFSRVLTRYLIPRDDIDRFIAEVRADGYQILRTPTFRASNFDDLKLHIPDMEVSAVEVKSESSVHGQTIKNINLRKSFGVTLVALKRGNQTITNPSPNEKLHTGDVLFLIGSHKEIACALSLFREKSEPDCE